MQPTFINLRPNLVDDIQMSLHGHVTHVREEFMLSVCISVTDDVNIQMTVFLQVRSILCTR